MPRLDSSWTALLINFIGSAYILDKGLQLASVLKYLVQELELV